MRDPVTSWNETRPARGDLCPRLTLTVLVLVDGEAVPFHTRFDYDRDDPLAVRMAFLDAPDPARPWVFSRDLLYAGLHAPAGDGAVRVRPPCRCHSPTMARILLHGGRSAAALYVPAAELHDWLEGTYAAVRAGEEASRLRVDDMLRRLVRGG
ncbi:hypothetical protein AQJ66_05280 [Streptomyces bungoensis]|uniref:Sporulation and cell division protein SsgA n=1 Tax=Streptomyces bungoensis TaxID=285568 RepID=A0A101TAX8_9ACTN|nr:SsgA family sporulation/cell division regulator [Streptomyces bungoensis]KUN88883.1 hypothetical protein AQJ66_05280 [Streptomyces bungoensis]